jgi:hypothetical protein
MSDNKVQIPFEQNDRERIDDWRRLQSRIPNFNQAVRELVRRGLSQPAAPRKDAPSRASGS